VFFDRDGVVNVSPGGGYVLRLEDFHLSPGIVDALRTCKRLGYATVVVTSQQGVGKGLMTRAALDEIHYWMQTRLGEHQAAFDGIYACTCLASDPRCTCRKPSPEMILQAAGDLDLDLARGALVGDHDRDIQMAINAGVPVTIRITGPHHTQVPATHTLDDTTSLAQLLGQILPPL
jgi:D-glycero-D-manno-heptose 1,7-bisphosphate phosphatase